MIPDSEARQWCARAAAGDREAACALLREFQDPIHAYLRRLSANDADASDLTQITFVKVWQSLGRFQGASSVSTWVHRIAYCSYIDWRRRSRPAATRDDEWWQHLPAGGPAPSELAATLDIARKVHAAVDHLPEEERQAIHLHYYQNLTLAESAEVMELPLSTLKYRLRNALGRLRGDLPVAELPLPIRAN